LILTGQSLTAEEARALGLVNRVVPENQLRQTVDRITARINEFSGPVLAMTKAVIGNSMGMPLRDAIKNSRNIYLNQLMDLEDVREGLQARIEQRKPVWKNK
jgi:enoyl-CoA hydratase/carnithine racemase